MRGRWREGGWPYLLCAALAVLFAGRIVGEGLAMFHRSACVVVWSDVADEDVLCVSPDIVGSALVAAGGGALVCAGLLLVVFRHVRRDYLDASRPSPVDQHGDGAHDEPR